MDQIQNTQTSLQPLGLCNPPNFDSNVDYVISDYMERLGTRLNILETELKYAWRALDLLSQEYIKMWERLEKLECLLYEQQSVISQLLEFYTSGGGNGPNIPSITEDLQSTIDNRLGQLEVIREILGNGAVEDGLEEGIDVSRSSTGAPNQIIQQLQLEMSMDEARSDEAFYRSLNRAYRDDLVGEVPSRPSSQLGMIWEEEEGNEKDEKKDEIKELEAAARSEDTSDVFSALDYKDYRGNSPCINDQDIAQLSRISSINHLDMERDLLSAKNPRNLPENGSDIESKALADDTSVIDEQLRQIYTETDNWNFPNDPRSIDDLILLSNSNLSSNSKRSSSRLSMTDSVAGTDLEVAETLAGGFRTPTSPRRRHIEITTCSAPYTTVTGRLAYSAAVMNAEHNAKLHSSAQDLNFGKYPNNSELNHLIAASYETIKCASPIIYNVAAEKPQSPTPSISSVRTRKDGYIGSTQLLEPNEQENSSGSQSTSPPPPAPGDHIPDGFLAPESGIKQRELNPSPVFLGPNSNIPNQSSINLDSHGRLSPRSPKSPRTSPKKKDHHHNSANIVAAKSDSGLSSMSGWSSLEKSPGSPKNGALNQKIHQQALLYNAELLQNKNLHGRSSPMPPQVQPTPFFVSDKPFTESETDSYLRGPVPVPVCNSILPGGHHTSAFTTVKSPCSLQSDLEGYGTFVPAPAPASDINVSPRRKQKHHDEKSRDSYTYTYEPSPAIYSVAGSRQEAYTSVYTSNSADYIPQTINYPDLLEPYGNSEPPNAPPSPRYPPEPGFVVQGSSQDGKRSGRSSAQGQGPPEGVANHEGYKNAMYRTMFPSGNITDALSYYPTSQRYEQAVNNLPRADYNDPATWLNCPEDQRPPEFQDKTVIDPRKYHQEIQRNYPQEPVYQNQEQIRLQQMQIAQAYQQAQQARGQRPDMPYLELDLRNRNVPDYIIQQQQRTDGFYDPSGVIVSQSGYLSIAQDLKDRGESNKSGKKLKRGNTLKSAMNQVSHWLPDLHLTRRHRSHSLPSSSRLEEDEKSGGIQRGRMSVGAMYRKKKKMAVVSAVSGFIQKAKKKGFHSHSQPSSSIQSLSDPEHSENEWVTGRVSASLSEDDRSERDSDSVFSDIQAENMFAKVASSKPKGRNEIAQNQQYQRQGGQHPQYQQFPGPFENQGKQNQHPMAPNQHPIAPNQQQIVTNQQLPMSQNLQMSPNQQMTHNQHAGGLNHQMVQNQHSNGSQQEQIYQNQQMGPNQQQMYQMMPIQNQMMPPNQQQTLQNQQIQFPQNHQSNGSNQYQMTQKQHLMGLNHQMIQNQQPMGPNQQSQQMFQNQFIQKQKNYTQDQAANYQQPPQYLAINNENGRTDLLEGDLSDRGNKSEEENNSGKSTGSQSASNLFATIGDLEKNSGSSEKSDDSTTSESRPFPPVALPVGGASMEFAVSRALGKYRQRQSSSVSDEQTGQEDQTNVSIPEKISEQPSKLQETPPGNAEAIIKKSPSLKEDFFLNKEEVPTKKSPLEKQISAPVPIKTQDDPTQQVATSEGSPSAASFRGHGRFLPRHQQSLEIPGRDDDDVRSTHSGRSTSRVSSRRQSTEDSIDSEDEWYCYELRKLEEMERQSQMEENIEEAVLEEPELEEHYTNEERYEPDEEVKENMSFVLRELRMKAKVVDGVLDEGENKRHTVASAKRRENDSGKKNDYHNEHHHHHQQQQGSLFPKVSDYASWEQQEEEEGKTPVGDFLKVEVDDNISHSSGETSGPDSPQHSIDEYEEAEIAEEDLGQSRRDSGRDGSFSVQSSISVPVSEKWDEETATIKSGSTETATTATLPLPKIKIDTASCVSQVKEEIGKDAGPLGSKWKLLKALKERKAEEKSNQEKKEEIANSSKDKVYKISKKHGKEIIMTIKFI